MSDSQALQRYISGPNQWRYVEVGEDEAARLAAFRWERIRELRDERRVWAAHTCNPHKTAAHG